jgi:arsenate reductase-like glutaredoxin family protein
MTCKKAQGFLEKHAVKVKTISDARKQRQGRDEALRLAKSVSKVFVVKGKNITAFDMTKNAPDDDVLLAHLLGPTGNLRAPTVRVGQSLLVGFNEEAYQRVMGRDSSPDK